MSYFQNGQNWNTEGVWVDTDIKNSLHPDPEEERRGTIEDVYFNEDGTKLLLWNFYSSNENNNRIGQYVITLDHNWDLKNITFLGNLDLNHEGRSPFTFIT